MGMSEMIPREAGGTPESNTTFSDRCFQGILGHRGNQVKTPVWVTKPTVQKSRCELSSWHVNTVGQVGGSQRAGWVG